MAIKILQLYSSNYNSKIFKPEVIIKSDAITILPDKYVDSNNIFYFDKNIDIFVPKFTEKKWIKVFFVKDLEQNEIIVVTDSFNESGTEPEWFPDTKKHKIIHHFISVCVDKDFEKIEDLDIYIYKIDVKE